MADPDPLVVVLGEIRDVLAEIRDQLTPSTDLRRLGMTSEHVPAPVAPMAVPAEVSDRQARTRTNPLIG